MHAAVHMELPGYARRAHAACCARRKASRSARPGIMRLRQHTAHSTGHVFGARWALRCRSDAMQETQRVRRDPSAEQSDGGAPAFTRWVDVAIAGPYLQLHTGACCGYRGTGYTAGGLTSRIAISKLQLVSQRSSSAVVQQQRGGRQRRSAGPPPRWVLAVQRRCQRALSHPRTVCRQAPCAQSVP